VNAAYRQDWGRGRPSGTGRLGHPKRCDRSEPLIACCGDRRTEGGRGSWSHRQASATIRPYRPDRSVAVLRKQTLNEQANRRSRRCQQRQPRAEPCGLARIRAQVCPNTLQGPRLSNRQVFSLAESWVRPCAAIELVELHHHVGGPGRESWIFLSSSVVFRMQFCAVQLPCARRAQAIVLGSGIGGKPRWLGALGGKII